MSITVGQKVKIIQENGYVFGTVMKVYPPCDYHSGRFTVLIHDKYMSKSCEFWFSDYGKTVMKEK